MDEPVIETFVEGKRDISPYMVETPYTAEEYDRQSAMCENGVFELERPDFHISLRGNGKIMLRDDGDEGYTILLEIYNTSPIKLTAKHDMTINP